MDGFLKFRGAGSSDGKPLFWHRAGTDRAPFRGAPPLLRDDEWEDKVSRVQDAGFGVFDTSQPAQQHFGRTYRQVLDAILAGWFTLLHKEHTWGEAEDGSKTMLVYLEWAEPYLELPPEHRGRLDSAYRMS